MERKENWVRTLVAQIAICLGLYLALQMGRPQKPEIRASNLYFMSVGGGFRPLHQQRHLLNQMGKVARKYKARFVVNIGEHGEDDPLMRNATQQFSSLKVPWYSTGASKAHEKGGYFWKKVNISHGKTLDIVGLNTGLLPATLMKPSDETERDQLHWLQSILKATTSNWRIIFGFHSLIDKKIQTSQVFRTLEPTFTNFEVDAYISGQDFVHQTSVSHVETLGANVNGESNFIRKVAVSRKMDDGFLLHRVSSLELVTYFVSSDGEVIHRSVLQQTGREVM